MKKSLSFIVALFLILPLLLPAGMAADVMGSSMSEGSFERFSAETQEETAVYQKATLKDDFKDDRIIVVLKHAYSEMNAEYVLQDLEAAKSTAESSFRSSQSSSETVEFESIEDLMVVDESAKENSLVNTENFKQILSIKLTEPGKENVLKAISELEQLDMVWAAVPDYNYEVAEDYTPNDPYFSNGSQWGTKKISAESAWNITTGNANIKVGIMESGIASHSDLNANVQSGNFTPPASADLSHGTHVAGIIGGVINNGIGIAGTAQVTMIPLDRSNLVNTLTYAMNNNISIINASFYYAQYDADGNLIPASANPAHEAAISNYNGLLVCSAGNSGKNTDVNPQYPAGYTLSNVISVGASTSSDTRASFSNYGANSVDLFAPGEGIYSTVPGNAYASYNGTSMAAPYVSGTLALMMAAKPGMDPLQMKDILLDSVDAVSSSGITNYCTSGGRLNASKAVSAANKMIAYFPFRFTADVNGDGRDDIIQIRVFNGQWQFYTFLGKADGSVSSSPIKTLSWRAYDPNFNVFVTDVNGDGRADIVVHWTENGGAGKRQLLVYRGKSDGSFYEGINTLTENLHNQSVYPTQYFVGDFNGDGYGDFLAYYQDFDMTQTNLLYPGTSSGKFGTPVRTNTQNTYNSGNSVFVGDFNGDGCDDIVVHWVDAAEHRNLLMYRGSSNGTFSNANTTTSNRHNQSVYPTKLFVGDFNGDGCDDILAHYQDDDLTRTNLLYPGTSSGTFGTPVRSNTTNTYVSSDPIYIGDVNGDGCDDIIVHWTDAGYRQLMVYPGAVSGLFQSGINLHTWSVHGGIYSSKMIVGDMNGDGRSDFVVEWSSGNDYFKTENVFVYRGTTSATFLTRVHTETTAKYYFYMRP